jgi:hypothetical protein
VQATLRPPPISPLVQIKALRFGIKRMHLERQNLFWIENHITWAEVLIDCWHRD